MSLIYDWLKASAKGRGSAKALVYRDNYLSWRGLLHRVDRRAREFESMGVKEHAWVGLMLGNVPDFVVLALALSKLKAVIVPIDPTTGTRELEQYMSAVPLRALVTRPRGSEGIITASGATRDPNEEHDDAPEELPEIRKRLQGTLLTCSVFRRDNDPLKERAVNIMFTADTLGDPKAVVRTETNLIAATDAIVKALDVDRASRILTAVPLYHAYAWDIGLLPALKTGATLFLEEEISARRVAKLLRDHKIDILPGNPVMYAELSRLPTAKALKVEKPRFISSGSPIDASVASLFQEKYEVPVLSCYYATETSMVSIDTTGKAPQSVGKTVDGIEIKRTNKKGTEVTGGKLGEIWVKADSVASTFFSPFDQEAVSEDILIGEIDKEKWFRTGDRGKFDRSSRLVLVDRLDQLVKIEGKRVALGEVEGCIEAFGKVKAAHAYLDHDPITHQPMVLAKVVLKSKCPEEAIIDHCAKNLAPYKVPRRVEITDSLD